jgi:hypothetical protein
MARFYGVVSGQARSEGTRLGSPKSGLRTECRGWNLGVNCYASADGDVDTIDIYATGGSNGRVGSQHLGTVRVHNGHVVFVPTAAHLTGGNA